MNELRLNTATNSWVIIASERQNKPYEHERSDTTVDTPEYEHNCPFCPGNKSKLENIISEKTIDDQWVTRVVNNKYPALSQNATSKRQSCGLYFSMGNFGKQEIIIESQKHNDDIGNMSEQHSLKLIETYYERYTEAMKDNCNMFCIIFKNHGKSAGTSLIHPHTQLAVTSIVPQHVRLREAEAQRYFDKFGKCVFCEIINEEIKINERIIYDNDTFVSFVPYFAEVPYEVWIMPKRHEADFGSINKIEKYGLADSLRKVLQKIKNELNDPDYNFIIHSAAKYKAGEPQLHWYLQIKPRTTINAGFEIGTGIPINPSIPEKNAELLKINKGR